MDERVCPETRFLKETGFLSTSQRMRNAIANDTGEEAADGITSDPAIAGSVIDVSGIFS